MSWFHWASRCRRWRAKVSGALDWDLRNSCYRRAPFRTFSTFHCTVKAVDKQNGVSFIEFNRGRGGFKSYCISCFRVHLTVAGATLFSQLRRRPNCFNLYHQMQILAKLKSLTSFEQAHCVKSTSAFANSRSGSLPQTWQRLTKWANRKARQRGTCWRKWIRRYASVLPIWFGPWVGKFHWRSSREAAHHGEVLDPRIPSRRSLEQGLLRGQQQHAAMVRSSHEPA